MGSSGFYDANVHLAGPEFNWWAGDGVFLRSLDGKWHCDGQDNGEVKLKKLLGSYGELLQRYDDAYDGARSAKHLHALFWLLILLGGTAGFFAMMWVAKR